MIGTLRVNNTVICTIKGKMYQKTLDTDSEVDKLYDLALKTNEKNKKELSILTEIFAPGLTEEEEVERIEFEKAKIAHEEKVELLAWMEDIKANGHEIFNVVGISLFIKGINITIPEFLAIEFETRKDNPEDLSSLVNFWRLCALNSDPQCREDLYKFLINNNMVVTPSGYFLAYRNANVKQAGDRKLNEFVNDQFVKIKNWKKSTKNYIVLENLTKDGDKYQCRVISNDNDLLNFKQLGTVDGLYKRKRDENATIYTDPHSSSTIISIGQPVAIPRTECNSDAKVTCSRGLHLGSTNFMSKNYFGSVGLVCLCNPMNVVAVPYSDGQKLRTSEYLPIGIAEYGDDNKLVPVETATFEYDYAEYTEEQLEDMLSNASFKSLKEHKIISQDMKFEDFRSMVNEFTVSNDVMKKTINNRIQKV